MISLINRVANGIDRLIECGIISSEKEIVIYGLHRYSFAMRTILSHRNIQVSAFLSEDEVAVLKTRRSIKDFACRYFKSERDVIDIYILGKEKIPSSRKSVILLAEEDYDSTKRLLEQDGYKENVDFFLVYDFYEKEIDGIIGDRKRLSLDEIKDYGRGMLKVLDEYCNANNLRYWVCGGTMLGAVRHKGFIPWDDDIDVFLPLDDYMKLIKNFPKSGRYSFKGYGLNGGDGFYFVYTKMIDNNTYLDDNRNIVRELSGVFLDIFPLVGLPENRDERNIFFGEYQELERSVVQDFYGTDGDLSVFEKRFPEQEKYVRKYSFDESEYVGVLGTRYGAKDCTKRDVYSKTLRMKFDDIEVNVPSGYDEYLSSLYGVDYMSLPPLSMQQTFHKIKAYIV